MTCWFKSKIELTKFSTFVGDNFFIGCRKLSHNSTESRKANLCQKQQQQQQQQQNSDKPLYYNLDLDSLVKENNLKKNLKTYIISIIPE